MSASSSSGSRPAGPRRSSPRRPRGPKDAPRRLLTDWTTTAGLAGTGLTALVAGADAAPEAVHLATLDYTVFWVDGSWIDGVTSDGATSERGGAPDLPSTVHAVDLGPEPPEQWHGRFALLVCGPDDVQRLLACIAPAGLMVIIGDADRLASLATGDLTQVALERGADPDDVARGADPDDSGLERFRAVYARL